MKDFCRDLQTPCEQPRPEINTVIIDITTEVIKRALKDMKEGKTPEDGISIDLIIDAGEIATRNLANVFNTRLINGKTSTR